MKAISTGNIFRIYDDTLRTYDKLPAYPYVVRFSMNSGFYLERHSEIQVNEPKIYGVHLEKVEKVLDSFERCNRSLGVILSGDKGIGKSLFAKLLSRKAIERELPLIIVDRYIVGIASYLESIEQEAIVLFDEFDKTFGEVHAQDGEATPQSTMLSLFDGISAGKKLFVITCNSLNRLNDYLINRPGRFHYHFRFEYPSSEEIREYLQDKLPQEYYGEINDVISFSKKVNLNYDCLRAIAFEIVSGGKFKEAIKDLNIINMGREQYQISLRYRSGQTLIVRNVFMDLFNGDDVEIDVYDRRGRYLGLLSFNTADCLFESAYGETVVHADKLKMDYSDERTDEEFQKIKEDKIEQLTIVRMGARNLHYAV